MLNSVGGLWRGLHIVKAPNPAARAVYQGLVAWWDLDDNAANSNVTDQHGGNTGTLRTGGSTDNTNSQTSTGGPAGRYWNPNRVDSRAVVIPRSNTALDMTTDEDHCIGGWFRSGNVAATTSFLIGRVGSAFAKLHFWIFVDGSDNIIKTRYSADNTTAAVTTSSTVAVDGTNWHLVIANYCKTDSALTIRLRKVNGSLNSGSQSLGSAITNTSNDCNFAIGEGVENDTTFDAVNNRNAVLNAQSCFYSKMKMTDGIFDYLFNGGNGRTYQGIRRDAF